MVNITEKELFLMNVDRLILERGIKSRRQLALKSGISYDTLYSWFTEHVKGLPGTKQLQKLADALDTTIVDLLVEHNDALNETAQAFLIGPDRISEVRRGGDCNEDDMNFLQSILQFKQQCPEEYSHLKKFIRMFMQSAPGAQADKAAALKKVTPKNSENKK